MARPLSELISTVPAQPGTYVLLGVNGMRYTGAARNLLDRLKDHQAGRGKRTKNQRPLWLLHVEVTESYTVALERERFLKSGAGRAWLDEHQTVSP